MKVHWYEPFEDQFGVSVRAGDGGDATQWEFFVNVPRVGRIHAHHKGAPLAVLRGRVAAEASLSLRVPGYFPGYDLVVRGLWFDRVLGDVPVAYARRFDATVPA